MTLIIMAAGMGSRFGGLKQIEEVHDNGEFILDYSIYDAIKNGFDKIVFIIKKDNYDIFRNTIGKRIEEQVDVKYVFQDNSYVPKGISIPSDRVKPLGTGHAILCCKDIVDDNFMVINADDFYGNDAYLRASKFIKKEHAVNSYGMIGYKVNNTLTINGEVKRGICSSKGGFLSSIVESKIYSEGDLIIAETLDNKEKIILRNDTLVSMNMFIFTPTIFDCLEKSFLLFLENNRNNLNDCEFFLPSVVEELINEEIVTVEVLPTVSVWKGITYKEDKELLVNHINELVCNGTYPDNLWRDKG